MIASCLKKSGTQIKSGYKEFEALQRTSSRINRLTKFWSCVAAALLYVLAGTAGTIVTQSYGYASPIWPSAGLAVASLLFLGSRCWFGVWIGALIIDLWFDPTLAGGGLSALTAAGATTQALVSALFVRRFYLRRDHQPRDRRLALMLLLAGPISCLIAASFGVMVLGSTGRIPTNELLNEWLSWWIGDTLGVLLFTPLAYFVWPRHRARTLDIDRSYRFALPLLVVSVLLIVTYVVLTQLEVQRARSEVQSRMSMLGNEAVRDINETLLPLEGLAQFITASEHVTREQFRLYAQSLINRPAMIAIDWAPRVFSAQRTQFEAHVVRDGFSDFQINELDSSGHLRPASTRDEYFPILYSEPIESSSSVLGLDHSFEQTRRQAMAIAQNSGKAISSDLIQLVRNQKQAFFAYVPVWHLADRNEPSTLKGFVVGVVDLQKLFAPLRSRAKDNQFALRISDINTSGVSRILVDNLPVDGQPLWQRDFNIEGRNWRIEMLPFQPLSKTGSAEERIFLFVALLTALLAAFATLSSAERQAFVARQVSERTVQLSQELDARAVAEQSLQVSEERYRQLIELSPFGVLVQCDGRCIFVNTRTIAMFGAKDANELIGQALLDYIHPDSRAIALERLNNRAEGKYISDSVVLHYRRLDGCYSWVELTSVPYQYDGRIGSLVMLNDISARIQAEEQRDRFFTLALDLFCIAGTDGYFRSVNPSFTRVLGWSENELLSKPFVDFVHPEDVEKTIAEIELIKNGASTLGFENRYLCKNGEWRWLEWKAIPQPGGLLFATAHDTTTQHLAALQLNGLNTELQQQIKEREAALRDLGANKQELRAVLDHLLECVITIDSHGIILTVNPAVEALLDYRPEDLQGRNISCLMSSPLREQHDAYIASYLLTGERHVIGSVREVKARHKSGVDVDVELSVSEFNVNGEHLFVGTLRDIRERKKLIATLTKSREEAEQASRAKSTFLATMSHEIRTPMNGVVGLIDILAEESLTPRHADLVKTIRESSSNLLGVIEDILDFSKIEAGKLEIEHEPLNLPMLIDSVCSSLKPMAAAGRVVLNTAIVGGTPHWVFSDAVRLRQILFNLIGNAIKFSGNRKEKSGIVTVCVHPASLDPISVTISVEDNGIGIAPEHLDKIFTAFTQTEASTSRRFGGSGLGLAICKRLTDLLGGFIEVASTQNKGSCFKITLPFVEAEAPVCSDVEFTTLHAKDRSYRAGKRILVVEDDPINRKVIAQQLSLFEYDFVIANNAVEALSIWRSSEFKLILTDLHMPEMDGFQLSEKIRSEEAGQNRIPILALTANALHSEKERALAAGVDEYLTKPIRLAVLENSLDRWLSPKAEKIHSLNSVNQSLLQIQSLIDLVGNSREMIDEIIRDYLKALNELSVDLINSYNQHDMNGVSSLAHRLKSSSRSVGAHPLGQLFEEIEKNVHSVDLDKLSSLVASLPILRDQTIISIEKFLNNELSLEISNPEFKIPDK